MKKPKKASEKAENTIINLESFGWLPICTVPTCQTTKLQEDREKTECDNKQPSD